ncbi:hypothetical protein FNJ84_02750 [Paracoccus sp. M683]|uniref:ImuA family protein n=1 Tax=Paracoccus sp. M683 TaxID=2594268 RepID=UPI00117EA2CF|nr:hypothetical protein [Paracoccus sp. M683]TRW99614.1 hypothetical protein FNJ84_02750 [Paracoccus sp. M683]
MAILSFPAVNAPPAPIPAAPALSEIFLPPVLDAGGMGFLMAQLTQVAGPVLWVQDRQTRRESGAPYLPGLGGQSLLLVELSRPADVLMALEDGLRCPALSAVVGEIWGDPAVLDFTATRRLAVRSEAAGIPCWLLRRGAHPNASAARNRLRIGTLPSAADPDDPASPGDPRWQVELFRCRAAPPGTWAVRHERASDRLDFADLAGDRALVETKPGLAG